MLKLVPCSIAVLLLTLVSCKPMKRADLVFINGGEPETLDPAILTAQIGFRVSGSLFEGLTRQNEKGEIQPGMAERWEISEDGKQYTFYLRKGTTWSNGDRVVADDFVGSWKRALLPETGSDYAGQLYCIKGAKKFSESSGGLSKEESTSLFEELVGVKAVSDSTLSVELEFPTPYFLGLVAFMTYNPVPLKTVEQIGDAWIKPEHIVTNGPYLLQDWKLEDRIRLVKNPNYWDADNVAMGMVDILPLNNPNTAINFFISGTADLIMDKGMIPPGMTDALRPQKWFHSAPFLGTYFLRFNTTRPPFDDVRVRRAFAKTVDKKRIVEKITRLGEPVADGFVPPGAGDNFQKGDYGIKQDIEGANRLLEEAGYKSGKGMASLELLLRPKSIEGIIASELKEMWQEGLGVSVTMMKQEQKVYLATQKNLEFHISHSGWVGDYNDPNTFMDMFTSYSGNNRTGFKNMEYDQLIEDAGYESDKEKRNEIFRRAEKILVDEEAVLLPLYHYTGVQFYHGDRLGGVSANLLDVHPFRCMYWKN